MGQDGFKVFRFRIGVKSSLLRQCDIWRMVSSGLSGNRRFVRAA